MFPILKKCKVFISHKRVEGKVSFDANWFEEKLRDKGIYNTFMDVREDYIGNFPKVLADKIKKSDVFLLVLPSDRDLDYLSDSNNWVHKEIQYVLDKKRCDENSIKIIPVSFKDNIVFPPKNVLGSIAEIADYSIIYCDINDQDNSKKRLYNAIGYKTWQYYLTWKSVLVILFLSFSLMFFIKETIKSDSDKIIQNYIEAVEKMKPMIVDFPNNENVQLADKLQGSIFRCFELVVQMNPDANHGGTEEERVAHYRQILEKLKIVNDEYACITKLYIQLIEFDSKVQNYCKDMQSLKGVRNKQLKFDDFLTQKMKEAFERKEKALKDIVFSNELWDYLDAFRIAYEKVYVGLNFWKITQMSDK